MSHLLCCQKLASAVSDLFIRVQAAFGEPQLDDVDDKALASY